ncbi:MAG: ATPase [Desulfobacterales bacterium]|nr:ATPase [Desulfobacterales bacterium]MCP4162384.1 ATPase [Deltaproteobacteria bacterium]
MVSVDGSVLIQIINFILLIIALNVVLYKPIRSILKQRNDKISGLEKGIETSKSDAEESEKAFGAGIKQARANGLKQKDALVDEATLEETKIISEINEKAQANLAETRQKIKNDIDGVRADLSKEVDAFANAISEKILGRAV